MELTQYEINPKVEIIRNATPSRLYKLALKFEEESEITGSFIFSGK